MEIWEFIFLNFRIKRKQHLSTLLLCWKRYYLYHVSSLRSDYLRIWYCKNFVFKARAGFTPFDQRKGVYDPFCYSSCLNLTCTGSRKCAQISHGWKEGLQVQCSFAQVTRSCQQLLQFHFSLSFTFLIWPFSNKITTKNTKQPT